ncbi:MAG TPA: glycosyl hydrolase family 28-related protein [Magnetospirillaceae bacterium]|jgi:hypothetical protein
MTDMALMDRRALLLASGGAAFGAFAASRAMAAEPPSTSEMMSARHFGAVGDGVTDDTAALQAGLDAAFSKGGAMLTLPPGNYRITRTLRIESPEGQGGVVGRHFGISGRGARIVSAIADGSNVLQIASNSTQRFLLLDGLQINGTGREGHGLVLSCDGRGAYLYNACLRDIVIEGCGGDGCQMVGNVFESQIFNSYFRDNHGNGFTFAHGTHGGILSAVHVFGCVFGQNGQHGAALERGCYDVSFNGCYFLLNAHYGLAAGNGCTLLNGCGFENNHTAAPGPDPANAGMRLVGFGTLIASGAYSIANQMALVDAVATGELVMIGCRGFGDGKAKGAGLGRFSGTGGGRATLIGCMGAIDRANGFDPIELGGAEGGMRFGGAWNSHSLPQLGEYRLWVDGRGRLRLKKGAPAADDDGAVVGT